MPDEPAAPAPDSSPSFDPTQRVGTGFVGETTRSISEPSPTQPRADSTTLSDDGTVLRPANPQREVIGDFEIISKLGQGGMGAVYRARQVSLDRQVALKILPATLEADADFVSRFQREARVAASLSHGNLVKVFSSGQADGCHYIAMELIEGETLGQWLKRSGALPPLEALRICAAVARALDHGWQKAQLIHRDIKPGNIFLSTRGDVKVGDLGLAKTLGGDTTGLTHTGTAMGTPHYISPEQARGDKDLDFRADIYSLGCTLYQMLTGRTPYEGRDPVSVMHQHIHGPPPAILKVLPSCPIPLARLVGKMLKKVKRERHASYAELLAQIDGVQALFAPTESALESTLPPDPDATLLATPGQTPRSGSATPATAPLAPPTTRPAPAEPKSKAALYGAIAAGVVTLGAVAFFAWPKEEKLTKAQLYAQQREAEAATRAAAATPAPLPPADSDLRPIATPQWQRLDFATLDPAVATMGRRRATAEGGLLRLVDHEIWMPRLSPQSPHLQQRNVALRARWVASAEPEPWKLVARSPQSQAVYYEITYHAKAGEIDFGIWERPGRRLKKVKLPRSGQTSDTVQVQFAVVGNTLAAWVDGKLAGTLEDSTIDTGGHFGLQTMQAAFKDFEYLLLDGLPEAEAKKLLGLDPGPSSTEAWRDGLPLFAEKNPGRFRQTAAGGEFTKPFLYELPGQNFRDGAIRARLPLFPEINKAGLILRRDGDLQRYVQLVIRADSSLILQRCDQGKFLGIASAKSEVVSPLLVAGQPVEVEFRAVGSKLTARVNGQIVCEGEDPQPTAGLAGINWSTSTATLVVPALEFLNLDAATTGTAAPSAPGDTATFGGHRYQLVPGLITWTEAKAKAEAMGGHLATFTSEAEERWVHEQFVAPQALTKENKHLYCVGGFAEEGSSDFRWITGEPIGEIRWKGGNPSWRELENNAVVKSYGGVRFAAGVAMGKEDHAGWLNVVPTTRSQVGGFLVEWDDAGSAAFATPATATKDAPFVNSLGMKFVPVPIIGGPTDGKRVLFSIWETRVQDYEVFATETKREWPKLGIPQEPTHPAIMIAMTDAAAFCDWLTARERAAGKLGKNETYRLPSDHEWSCAAGIGDREKAAQIPHDKSGKIAGVFPWGTTWPPPAAAGNYAGEEARVPNSGEPIPDYRDDFPKSSPVGSFAAQGFGLFDLGGNVWEFCTEPGGKSVMRGGSYFDIKPEALLSSKRGVQSPDFRSSNAGFRVVLVSEGPATPPAAASPSGEAGFVKELKVPGGFLRDFRLLPDGRRLLAGGSPLALLDLETGATVWSVAPALGQGINALAVSADGNRFATYTMLNGEGKGSLGGAEVVAVHIALYDVATGKGLQSWRLPAQFMGSTSNQIALSPSGQRIVARVAGELSKKNGRFVGLEQGTVSPITYWNTPEHAGHITHSLDEDGFLSTGSGPTQLLRFSQPERAQPWLTGNAGYQSALSPARDWLVATRVGTQLLGLWNPTTQEHLRDLDESLPPTNLTFAGNDRMVGNANERDRLTNDRLRAWEIPSGTLLTEFAQRQPNTFFSDLRGAADGRLVVVRIRTHGSGDGNTLQVWRLP